MADNKLKIRIQLQQSSTEADEPNEEAPPSESDSKQQPFDWKKISIAAVLAVIGTTIALKWDQIVVSFKGKRPARLAITCRRSICPFSV